jgi:hypothetical protein
MTQTNRDLNKILDEVTSNIRNEKIGTEAVNVAAERVWESLSSELTTAQAEISPVDRIRNCSDFQSLIPTYLQERLTEARALLLEDHTRECIPCRKALKEARTAGSASDRPQQADQKGTRNMPFVVMKWGVAALLIIGLSFIAVPIIQRLSFTGESVHAKVQSVTGPVFRVTDTESRGISSGEEIGKGERIRTAKDAGAVVQLADGSLIEMKERSEFSISDSAKGTTIRLERGNVIVQAAKQRSRHLYVSTNDCLVSVTGTIFSVNSGTKGSRVLVIEGEVHVDHNGDDKVLHPGDQVSTSQSLETVPVKEEISWSRDAERYLSLLAELSSIRNEINKKVTLPGSRYSTRLLDMVPEGTVFYAAIPNLSATISESQKILQERIQQNEALREWWESERKSSHKEPEFEQIVEKIREFGQYLGAEIVVSATMDEQGHPEGPLVLAELSNPAGIRPFIEQQIATLGAGSKNGNAIRFISDPFAADLQTEGEPENRKNGPEILIWINNDILVAAPRLDHLRQLATGMNSSSGSGFVGSPLYSRIADIYREGAGLVVAADLEKIIASTLKNDSKHANGKQPTDTLRQVGLLNLKYFVLELKENQGKSQNKAVLTFNEQRQGIASWLAAPGPMGALEFVSPDANVAAAFVVKEPILLVDDLLNLVPDMRKHLGEIEAKHGLNIRNDFAAPLGGEFAFAIDGPVLPTPAWKMVFEVYDPVRLQQSLERVIAEMNLWAAREGKTGFQWERAEIGGRTYHTLKSVDTGVEVSYTFTNGYLIVAPSKALVERAVRYRESGYTLLRSPKFTAILPEDGNTNFSALFYHDLSSLIKPFAEQMASSAKGLPAEQRKSLESLATLSPPSLAYAYAQSDRIVFATNSNGDSFGLSPASLLGLPGSFGIQKIVGEALQNKAGNK